MPPDNVVSIGIRAELGGFQSDMQKADAAVKRASANMSEALLQFGKAAEAGNLQAVAALKQYEAELQAAQSAVARLSVAESEEGSVLRGTMSARMAATAELRVLEGNLNGSTRAAGAFLTMLPGVAQAMQIAFPIFGAFALVSILGQAISKVADLTRAFEALDGAETKAGTDAILAGEKIVKIKADKFSMNEFARTIVGAPAEGSIEVQNASAALKAIQYQRELHDAQAQVAEQGLTGAALQKQKVADIEKEIGFTKEAKAQADLLTQAYVKQLEAKTKIETVVAGHSGVVRSERTVNTITDPKQIEAIQQQLRTSTQAAAEFNHELDMMNVKLQGAQVKESHAGDKSAAQAAKVEADAQFQIMLQNGQRQLEFQQRLTDSLNETWLEGEHVDQEVARKQEEFSREATRQFVEDQKQKIDAAKEAAEQQSRTADLNYRGVEQSTAGDVQEGTLKPAQRIAILQQAAAQEYAIKQASIEAQKALDVGNVAAYQQDLNKMTQLDIQYSLQKAQLAQQQIQALAQPYITAFNSINNQWLQLQDKLIFGTRNVGRAFANMGVGMLEGFAASVEKMAVKAVEADLKMLLSKQITTQQQVAITAIAAGQTTAIKQTEGLKQALIDAKSAAVSGWKAGMALPFPADLIAAPALAAAGFAGAIAQFDVGGIIPGSGAVPILGHGGERVLTQEQTRSFERLVNNTTNNSGGNASTVVHVHGFSDRLFRDQMARNAEHVTRAAQRGLRNKGRS